MLIKAVFAAGQTEITLPPLHQWDYGQQIEIEATDIPESIIEVHFSCNGMAEALVHTCTITGGKGTVSIPNRCLEQTNTITAWIYEIERVADTIVSCSTTKTMYIPIVARTRPARKEDIPESIVDPYTELFAKVNEIIYKLENDGFTAKHAQTANTAGSATNAQNAVNAKNDEDGNRIKTTYSKKLYLHRCVLYFSRDDASTACVMCELISPDSTSYDLTTFMSALREIGSLNSSNKFKMVSGVIKNGSGGVDPIIGIFSDGSGGISADFGFSTATIYSGLNSTMSCELHDTVHEI